MHCLAVKKLSALLIGITSEQKGNFYCLNCLHAIRTKNKLESKKHVCENENFCNIVMSSEDTKLSELNQYQKFAMFVKKNLKIKIKNITKLGTIVIIHGNREVLHRAYVIKNKLYLKKFL